MTFLRKLLIRVSLFLMKQGIIASNSRMEQLAAMATVSEAFASETLADVGFNVFSPTYEDGILLYLFSRIGFESRILVDIGAGKPHSSTVTNLIINHGFTGLLIDGDPKNCEILNLYYRRHPETKLSPPQVSNSFVTAGNIDDLISDSGLKGAIDLLCIDIDGVDYWVWEALKVVNPRVVVVEYQDILGPERAWTVPYDENFRLDAFPENTSYNNYCGASLAAFVKLAKTRGYRFVGVNRGAWNAFFVKDELSPPSLREVQPKDCFESEWNQFGMKNRFLDVAQMKWEEV
jgi:hypothetical protein